MRMVSVDVASVGAGAGAAAAGAAVGVAAGVGAGVGAAGVCAASQPAEQASRAPQSRARAANCLDLKIVLVISISFRVVCDLSILYPPCGKMMEHSEIRLDARRVPGFSRLFTRNRFAIA